MSQRKETRPVKGLLFNIIKLCRFSKNEADDSQFPIQQVEYLEKAGDSFVVLPYGVHANIPEDFLGLLLSAQEQNRFVMPLSSKERIHPVESGEVVFFHPVTKSKIHFKNNGDIDIETEADVNVACANANITASEDITATCVNASVSASTKATVTAPDIDLTGNVNITGTLDVSGISTFAANIVAGANVAVTGALTQGGKDVGKDHAHSQGNDSGGATEQDTSGVI